MRASAWWSRGAAARWRCCGPRQPHHLLTALSPRALHLSGLRLQRQSASPAPSPPSALHPPSLRPSSRSDASLPSAPPPRPSFLRFALRSIFGSHASPLRVCCFIAALLGVNVVVVDAFTGQGPSMLPTFAASGEVFVVEALSAYCLPPSPSLPPRFLSSLLRPVLSPFFSIRAGDVVLCQHPAQARASVAKRVIGLQGDAVRAEPGEPLSALLLPPGCVWLQGDHLAASRDSRQYGCVPAQLIRGRVVARIWPWRAAGRVQRTLEYRGY